MPLDLYLAFVAACALLIVIPGPNVALIVANSVAHGARYGLMTVAGTASAMVLQLALVVLGASALLGMLASRLRSLLQARARLRNRLTGGLLIGAGVGLALARRP